MIDGEVRESDWAETTVRYKEGVWGSALQSGNNRALTRTRTQLPKVAEVILRSTLLEK